jgi:cell division septation protein DedD
MAASVDNESEILLGNKQLLAVFAVVVLLLAVAFTGGYMLGKGSADKRAAATPSEKADAASDVGPLTKTVTPEDVATVKAVPSAPQEQSTPAPGPTSAGADAKTKVNVILSSTKQPVPGPEGTPKSGTFLQVGALTHTQAAATADVLRKQNFHARLAPKPGSSTIFRVLVGPVKDAGDLAATRDALRKIGFRDVIVQRY